MHASALFLTVAIAATPPAGPSSSSRVHLGALGASGVIATALGAAGIGAGLGLIIGQPDWEGNDEGAAVETRVNTTTPGAISLGLGAAIAAGGLAMLIIAVRRDHRARSIALAPAVGRTGAALSIRLRF